MLPADPCWLKQVHGTQVVDAATVASGVGPEADAAFTRKPATVCVVMTADCLPVLFCDRAGTVVAAAHAGWRGLLDGVLSRRSRRWVSIGDKSWPGWGRPLARKASKSARRSGWPLLTAMIGCRRLPSSAGRASGWPISTGWPGNACRPAESRRFSVASDCTFLQADRYFSYRRCGVTGRMASLIWLDSCTG
jgi:polyphenol oxidase